MAAATNIIPMMNWESQDTPEAFSLFKQKIELYLEDEEITDAEVISRKIRRGIGDEGLKRLNASGLTDDEKKVPQNLWTFFENTLRVNINFRIHRLQLMHYRQGADESTDSFITRARTQASRCDFTDGELQERLLELIIASTPHDGLRKELLGKAKGHPLNDALQEARKYEALEAGKQKIEKLSTTETVNEIKTKECGNCGRSHLPKKCPAYYSTCNKCHKKGHWDVKCRAKSQTRSRPTHDTKKKKNRRHRSRTPNKRTRSVHEIAEESEPDDDIVHFDAITTPSRGEVFTNINIHPPLLKRGNYSLKVKIDTGANGNTLPLRIFQKMYPENMKQQVLKPLIGHRLVSYNGSEIKCLGVMTMPVCHKQSDWFDTQFYVVDVNGPAIIGLRSSEKLRLVTVHVDVVAMNGPEKQQVPGKITSVDDLVKHYPDQFDKIGNFPGTEKLHLKDDAEPFIAAPRKCSVHLKDKIKHELESMESNGIIRRVDEHTDWCSSLAFTLKKDGSLRVCLDPKKLNENLKRSPHKIPTVEELNPEFARAKFFSKLDAKCGYWSIKLDEESQLLTTFRSPLGPRYAFLRLPFGLNVSQDKFQKRMDEILEGLDGVVGIADDVCVYGKTREEHDQRLINLMNRAVEKGLVFNSKKCAIGKSSISFYGNLYTDQGIKPDPQKVRDIQNMPRPSNKDELSTFLGMINRLRGRSHHRDHS